MDEQRSNALLNSQQRALPPRWHSRDMFTSEVCGKPAGCGEAAPFGEDPQINPTSNTRGKAEKSTTSRPQATSQKPSTHRRAHLERRIARRRSRGSKQGQSTLQAAWRSLEMPRTSTKQRRQHEWRRTASFTLDAPAMASALAWRHGSNADQVSHFDLTHLSPHVLSIDRADCAINASRAQRICQIRRHPNQPTTRPAATRPESNRGLTAERRGC